VNLSPVAIAAGVPWSRVERFGDRVVVEVSERDPVQDYATLRSTLDDLRDHGVQLAIDDVGAGHANMRHVLRLAPAYLKVDRSFVASIDRHAGQAALMRSITGFTEDLGIRVIAEGIERSEEGEVLRAIGVGYGQGYLVARPGAPPPAAAWPTGALPHRAQRWVPGSVPSRHLTP
jgi:EAL domain-containing protein (putative c-di-GMP-specific phosphodiesterase class I)